MYGYNIDLKLIFLNFIIEVNVGFKGELGLIKFGDEMFEEEFVWFVDNQIIVLLKYKIKVDLVIKEDEYVSYFKIESKFEGKIYVILRNKKDNILLVIVIGDVK